MNHKSISKSLFIFIILAIFIQYGNTLDNNFSSDTEDLFLSYLFDKKTNVLILKWNREIEEGKKYFVFRKMKADGRYKVINKNNPTSDNFFMISLEDNIGAYFIISEKDHLSDFPDDIKIVSFYPIDDMYNQFKRIKDDSLYQSNEVTIKIDDKVKSANLNIFEVNDNLTTHTLDNPFDFEDDTNNKETDFSPLSSDEFEADTEVPDEAFPDGFSNEKEFEDAMKKVEFGDDVDVFKDVSPENNIFNPENTETENGNNNRGFDIFNPHNSNEDYNEDNGNNFEQPFNPFQ